MLDEVEITKKIVESYMQDLLSYTSVDVAIVGAGPSGLTAAYYLAKSGMKVAIFDRKLSIGGGMWGGGMMFNKIVVQEDARHILDDFSINYERMGEYYVADSVHSVTALTYHATRAGAKIFNLIGAEDVIIKNNRVSGLVINWSVIGDLPIDPLSVYARYVVDATGHESEVVKTLVRKNNIKLNTPSGEIEGEHSMDAEIAERAVVENTKEIYPGIFVAGMAANAVFGSPRMGPIFGGMLLSGKKVAEEIIRRLQ
ncbi:thiazole biosynthesis enzyme [Aciduliprofundum sp. MAR08-339]|uniref:sulfide-dependent adenosine diphosphate thiazole synthase n=1 Tax=Aciduliprofundum sp. (strain MAR08-339) TaxID=673860 RepID=UPI0002A491C6|nr:thiazole biosynthesis enzyme [Aciduliprofundum sp. MAR08-339]